MRGNWFSLTLLGAAVAAIGTIYGSVLVAEDSFELIIRDHRFEPAELVIPAHREIMLVVRNEDAMPEEFESHDLNRELIIPGGATVTIYIGPLSAGTYGFFGEFHEDTAQGRIVVK